MLLLNLNGKSETVPDDQAYDAMRRFYQARRSGDSTASIAVVDDGEERFYGARVDDFVLRRMEHHAHLLAERGLVLPPPVYAPHELIVDVGDSSYRVKRRPWAYQALVADSLRELCRMISAEERYARVVDLSDLELLPSGAAQWGEGPIYFEEYALRQLFSASDAFRYAATYLTAAKPEVRSLNWGYYRDHALLSGRVKLQIRRNPMTGQFAVFSVVSPTYKTVSVFQISEHIEPVFREAGTRGTVVYDSDSANLRVDAYQDTVSVGRRVLRCGVQVRANDRGQGGIFVYPAVMMEPGLNRYILVSDDEVLFYAKHQGDMSRLSGMCEAVLSDMSRTTCFITQWRTLEGVNPAGFFLSSPEETISAYAPRFNSGLPRAQFASEVNKQLAEISGVSVADYLDAVTRLHQNYQVDAAHMEQVDEKAGELVANFAKLLPPGYGSQP